MPGCVAPYTVVGDGSGVDWTAGGNTTTVTTNCGVYAGACEPGAYYLPTTYNSTNPFTVFNGVDLNGIWTIIITDNIISDNGVLNTWGLTFPADCYDDLESVTPDLVTATWTGGGTVPVTTQSTSSTVITDPGPDLCPGSSVCQGTELTNSPMVGPFVTPGAYTYTLTVVDEFGCEYEQDVVVTATCTTSCILTLDTANNDQIYLSLIHI